jgi:hypothetical protein
VTFDDAATWLGLDPERTRRAILAGGAPSERRRWRRCGNRGGACAIGVEGGLEPARGCRIGTRV